ncbi:P-loop containing nucleoside triphosphate hydrolase protein [Cutaneotrichosporon oleaginosum]|uniref:p-loop containing nucleoside triphosphate hydrolase protein n=1 Tax=Cutaneotrichosporon oleaginosum TaxID=879819 RepID=A0A0J0XDR9_9TREE|nr:P-loop containing nucleoside triphosphate hydrolase protein [Cutaneotrichosporon oleaginosum]KLT39217.1 P-loop containing nucleoside triphosphate hydrolase protein [Cutaneotrichosporon oleaginosum]TXT05710.1 hypothetical protein COLE_07030 [Cutaneotrichosporon oleaginosum]
MGPLTQWHIVTKKKEQAHALIQEVMQYSNSVRDVIWVFEMGGWRPDKELWDAVQKASWDDVVLEADFKKSIQNDYRTFFKSEETYKRLNIPWKRGLIFLGPPGNGKTISLKAIMHEMDVPTLYVRTLTSFMGDEFSVRQIFERARQEAPCILILEDLDSIITDRSRSFFLNEVDGINANDGILMIGTTNHFDCLDPGLANRPSRFDRKYNFPNPSKEQRRDYALFWQGKLKDNKDIEFPDDLVDEFADKTDKFSFAYMKEAL